MGKLKLHELVNYYHIGTDLSCAEDVYKRQVYMDTDTLKKYDEYTKPLEERDRRKAENLLAAGRYTDVMSYMLEKGKKLEQEIVSWMEWKGAL